MLRSDDIDDYLKAQMRWERIPGLSIVVVRDGQILKAGGYGFSNLETDAQAGADSVYKMGSLSKQFLAAGLLVLVQDGKVGLDDPVNKYLPGVPEAWKPITVRNLLTHTSGISTTTASQRLFKRLPACRGRTLLPAVFLRLPD